MKTEVKYIEDYGVFVEDCDHEWNDYEWYDDECNDYEWYDHEWNYHERHDHEWKSMIEVIEFQERWSCMESFAKGDSHDDSVDQTVTKAILLPIRQDLNQ